MPHTNPEDKKRCDRAYYLKNHARIRTRNRAWYAANKKYAAAAAKEWQKNNPERRRVIAARWRRKNPGKVAATNKRNRRANSLKYNYDLTVEAWEAMFEAQDRRCACCGTTDPRFKKGWLVDHDHVTNTVRGIICHPCNVTLGRVGDNLEAVKATFDRFVRYLTR